MATDLKASVLAALARVIDPASGRDIVAAGMVQGLALDGGRAVFALEVDPSRGPSLEALRQEAEKVAAGVPGITEAVAVLTAERAMGATPRPTPHGTPRRPPAKPERPLAPGVKHIIAVASGKGGVGKSTVAANLAAALAASGLAVGLLDADIYGPSVPRLMGNSGAQPRPGADGLLQPMEAHGLKTMSMGFLIGEEEPMIWRGPMIQTAIQQLLRDVAWGALDVLVVDMPPGTGDAQLTLSQKVPLAGAVIVSTPQDLALIDAKKGLAMFRKVNVPVLGIVENMSYYCCPGCGRRDDVFGHGGAAREAARLGVELLGEIPLLSSIRELSDAGTPVVLANPDSPESEAFRGIARRVRERLAEKAA
jgi:ATP-binding protein involved in chromosome partitioning